LLLKQEGAPMFSVDLSTRKCDGHVVVGLRGELDIADAVGVAAALEAVAVRNPEIIVDLAGLDFIDSNGVAALARGREQARHAGGDLVLAAPRQQVLRLLSVTPQIGVFHIHASVGEAASRTGRSQPSAAPTAGRPVTRAVTPHGRFASLLRSGLAKRNRSHGKGGKLQRPAGHRV
jgi:anti-sigma B factor antagonist